MSKNFKYIALAFMMLITAGSSTGNLVGKTAAQANSYVVASIAGD